MDANDLRELDSLLGDCLLVAAMEDIYDGCRWPDVIGLRHDVDANPDAIETAVKIAAWEAERGYRATFFMLHTAPYWQDEGTLCVALNEIAEQGHEIGIHANAIADALRTGGDPADILHRALEQLRSWGHTIRGVVAHGDEDCYDASGRLRFVNDEMFIECARPEVGQPHRQIVNGAHSLRLDPRPLAEFGLDYEANRLPKGRYLSDSGGRWNIPLAEIANGDGQLHILQHPDWWSEAFKEA